MLAGAIWLFGWANAVFAFTADKLLNNPILQRVECDNCQPSSGSQGFDRQWKYSFYSLQFLVDSDAQGLKGAGCRMQSASSPAGRPANHLGQFVGGVQRPGGCNRSSDSPALRLFAVAPDQVCQISFRKGVDHFLGGCGLSGTEAHVQWAVAQEGKASFRPVQLDGRNPKVKHDPIDVLPTQAAHLLQEGGVGGLNQSHPRVKNRQALVCDFQRLGI